MPTIRGTAIINCRFDGGAAGATKKTGNGEMDSAMAENVNRDPRAVQPGCGTGGPDFEHCVIRNEGGYPPCCFRCTRSSECGSLCKIQKLAHSIPIKDMMDVVAVGGVDQIGILREDMKRRGYDLTQIPPMDNGKPNKIEVAEAEAAATAKANN